MPDRDSFIKKMISEGTSDDDIIATLKIYDSKNGVDKSSSQVSHPLATFGNQVSSAVGDLASGFGGQLSDYVKAVYGGNPTSLAASSQRQAQGVESQWKKSNEVGPVEGVARKLAIPLDIAGVPVTQTAEDIISGNLGGAAVHGSMALAGGYGLGKSFSKAPVKAIGPVSPVEQVKPVESIIPTASDVTIPTTQENYNHPQVTSGRYGIVPRNIHEGNPLLSTVPNRLQPPGANQAVFEALVPDSIAGPRNSVIPENVSPKARNETIVQDVVNKRKAKIVTPKAEVVSPQVETPKVDTQPLNVDELNLESPPEFKSNRLKNNPELAKVLIANKDKVIPEESTLKSRISNEKGSIQLGREKTPLQQENENAFKDYVNGVKAAEYRGGQLAKDNPELKDLGIQGITDYQTGQRNGPFQKVSDFFSSRLKQAVDAEILNEDQVKDNYLRQIWKESPEEISRVMKNISKTPGFSKHSIIKDYAAGIKAGLTPKYNNIADIMGVYEAEHGKALATKELYNYLSDTGQVKINAKGEPIGINNFNNWAFKGPHQGQLKGFTDNIFRPRSPVVKNIADVVSWTKNLYLSGGIPKTQLNMHGANIVKSDFQAQGAIKSLKTYFDGTFTPSKDRTYLAENQDMIPKFMEYGYEPGIEGHDVRGKAPVPLDEFLSKSKIGRGVKKGIEVNQSLFEDPLFKVHLPATKLKFAMERVKSLMSDGLSEEQAMRKASEDANIIYGGINKALRDKNVGDWIRIGVLAPDWLESRMRFAGKKVAASIRGVAGKSEIGDSLYQKAAARTLATELVSKGIKIYGGKTIYDMLTKDKPSQITNVPAGETSDRKKTRQIPVFGTSAEEIKIPEEFAASVAQRDPGYAFDFLKNKSSLPIRSFVNLVTNQDYTGNPLRKNDRYGRPISLGKASANMTNEATAAFKPQFATALADYYSGKITAEEAIAQGLELPVQYTTKPKVKARSPYR